MNSVWMKNQQNRNDPVRVQSISSESWKKIKGNIGSLGLLHDFQDKKGKRTGSSRTNVIFFQLLNRSCSDSRCQVSGVRKKPGVFSLL